MAARKTPAKLPAPKEPIEVQKVGDKATLRFNDPALLEKLGLDGLTPAELEAEVNRRILTAAKKPGRGRPPGKKSGKYNISLPLDVIDWLRDHPEGPAAVAERLFRAEMAVDLAKKRRKK